MRNLFFGAFCGVLVFAGLSLWTARRSVNAAVLASPPAGRFDIVQLHPNTDTEWSGILDTETGCTWVFSTNNPDDPQIKSEQYKFYLQVLGTHSLNLVNFDPSDYISAELTSQGGSTTQVPGTAVSYQKPLAELSRVQSLCSRARVQALEVAATR